jgi:colanic acid biosynthesis glycosyl transferase WcaI
VDLLFLNRSYWPDVEATGQLLTELCSDLARTHRVTVIAGRPNYVASDAGGLLEREEHNGVAILRVGSRRFDKKSLPSRVIGLLSYLVLAAGAALSCRRPAVIVVETDPPLLGALGVLLKVWHRCRLVFYLQDLYPEVGLAMGKLRRGPVTWLLWLATQIGLLGADRVIVLGEDMRQRVLARGVPPEKIEIVPNWVDTEAVRPLESSALRQEWGIQDEFLVMYSGNLGLSQNLEPVLEAAKRLSKQPIMFVFIGEGAAKAGLMSRVQEWGLGNVRFLPYQPKERLTESLGAADLHLIPLRRGLAGCIVPSKLYGILASGRPYLAAVDADSEVARVSQEHGTGVWIDPDNTEKLVEALAWCVAHRTELATMGQRGRILAEHLYDRRRSVGRFGEVLEDAVGCVRREQTIESDREAATVGLKTSNVG